MSRIHALMAVAAALIACSGPHEATEPVTEEKQRPACAGAEPCDTAWPEGLKGPFELREVRRVQVTSHDGTVLDGWLSFPDLPLGVRAPVVLNTSAYLSTCMVHPTSGPLCWRNPESGLTVGAGSLEDAGEVGGWWDEDKMQADQSQNAIGVFPIRWIRRGFVLANFNIRGTGRSGGCFDSGGRLEQLDQKALVEWLASQDWSNGRVGMGGLSYAGWTTWQAAVHAPRGLKAIASVAPVVDYYTFLYTAQGARWPSMFVIGPLFFPQYANPSIFDAPALVPDSITARAGCTSGADVPLETYGPVVTGVRSREFFEQRDLTPRLKDVRAAVLHAQGYADAGHTLQDRSLTEQLPAQVPARELRGWWPHRHPGEAGPFDPPGDDANWEEVVLGWFDYWLKGVGPRPRLAIDHQDQAGAWHTSKQWPPREVVEETRYLAAGALATSPGSAPASFQSVPTPDITHVSYALVLGVPGGASLCASAVGVPLALVYTAEASDDVVIAGNPYLDVRAASNLPRGVISVNLYDLAPDFHCDGSGQPVGASWLAAGGLDLEYYETKYEPRPFATDTPTDLRIDLSDVTAVVKAGHRLALVLGHGEWSERLAQPGAYPTITVYPESQVVLPIASGSFGN